MAAKKVKRPEINIKPLKMSDTQRLFVSLIIAAFFTISLTSWLVSLLVNLLSVKNGIEIPSYVVIGVISIITGFAVGRILNRIFLKPMDRLADSMHRVSQGDFNVRINEMSSLKEMNNLYENFNKMTGELSSTEILQTDFVANVSHEFKTPINAIEGYATLLQAQQDLPEETREYVDKILFNTERLSALVGNILLLSKVDNRSIAETGKIYRLDEQIRIALMQFEHGWEDKDLELDVDLEEMEFFGSESLMMHVWTNLISNAIKFSPVGGMLRLRLYTENENAVFTIDDSGPGIPETAKAHIFDKFYQGDTSHKSEGNGLGLALAKRILDSCLGEISSENLSPSGCRFTVTLPRS